MLVTTALVVFALAVVFSPAGRLKLGKPDDEPEFRRLSWFAMLFAAGMGTGLVFWGVAEPLNHYLEPHYADPATAAGQPSSARGGSAVGTSAMAASLRRWVDEGQFATEGQSPHNMKNLLNIINFYDIL